MKNKKRIAIQGVAGAFHEIAARNYFFADNVEIFPCVTFDKLITACEDKNLVDGAIMAIENSIAGSLLNNYRLLQDSNLRIAGEVYLRIKHQLLSLPGETLASLREVHSHPMAIAQCKIFFAQHSHIRLVESEDTALSAKHLSQQKTSGRAAIASKLAAENYGLNILSKDIETNKQNYTRFLILERTDGPSSNREFNKISISFSTKHKVGSLLKVLGILEKHTANLTKIQSTPIIGQKWEYLFFVDFILENASLLPSILEDMIQHTTGIKVLGTYKSGVQHES